MTGDEQTGRLVCDYYRRPFLLLEAALELAGYSVASCHPARHRYWSLLPRGQYPADAGRPLVQQYLSSLERTMSSLLRTQSLAYWLHLYRRLAPEPIGRNRDPMTVVLMRAALEAAIQKHALLSPCSRVGSSGSVPTSRVLGGLLMAPEFDVERRAVRAAPQLVLTDFGGPQLREFYDIEKLAYDVWKSSAMLRIIAKGAPQVVDDSEECVWDARSDELDELVRRYDGRLGHRGGLGASATGAVFDHAWDTPDASGIVFLPTYNTERVGSDSYRQFFSHVCGIDFASPDPFNFVWVPFNIRGYREVHRPFDDGFRELHGFQIDAVLLLITSLCERVLYTWTEQESEKFRTLAVVGHWQRAYDGPVTTGYLWDEIKAFLPRAAMRLGCEDAEAIEAQLPRAYQFLLLDDDRRDAIDLGYPGPHSVFLPYDDQRVFVDYAYLMRRLYDLFHGVQLEDQNFKGAALETLVRSPRSALPAGPCRSMDGEQRQIDAAFEVGDRLVVIECRARWRSIAFDRGDPEAIRFRNEMIDKVLADVDAKADWLAARPVGANYDVRGFVDILPVGVTPFAEYIPSLADRYWLTDDLPRVLTPGELSNALEDGTLASVSSNVVPVRQAM